ncbi:MAG: ABC transporter permease [Saccharofermentanales bacterium]|jgi:ribose transport system permease protein
MNLVKSLSNKKKVDFKHLFLDNLVVVAILLLVVVTAIVEPKFLTLGNMTNIMRQFGPLIMVSLGMTFVIIGGFVDLSVGGIFSLVAVVTIMLIPMVGQVMALILGLFLGAFCGFLNSALLLSSGAVTSAEAMFITYGMSMVHSALALLISNGSTQYMRAIEVNTSIFKLIGSGRIGFIAFSFILFLICLVVLFFIQAKTYIGRSIKMAGGNKTAAGLAGVPVGLAIISIFAISGLMTGLGAIVGFSRAAVAAPTLGKGYETNAILAVVVGGTSLKGGHGSVLKTVLGGLLIILMSNCLNLLGASTELQSVLKGLILVMAIWLDNRKYK